MGFQQGLSGLNAAAKNLDAIGNNVANAGTVGFKSSQAQFADVYAASLSGGGAGQIGLGTKTANVAQQFTQGNISATNNPLDVAINGGGFFRLDTNGSISYSRNGQFQRNKDGFIVSSTGAKVTGYGVDPSSGAIVATNPAPVSLPTSDLSPQETGGSASAAGAKMAVNLDSREALPVTATFNPLDPTSYNRSSPITVYDTLGNPHVLSMYFTKTATAGTWNLNANVDGTGLNVPAAAAVVNANTLAVGTGGSAGISAAVTAIQAAGTGWTVGMAAYDNATTAATAAAAATAALPAVTTAQINAAVTAAQASSAAALAMARSAVSSAMTQVTTAAASVIADTTPASGAQAALANAASLSATAASAALAAMSTPPTAAEIATAAAAAAAASTAATAMDTTGLLAATTTAVNFAKAQASAASLAITAAQAAQAAATLTTVPGATLSTTQLVFNTSGQLLTTMPLSISLDLAGVSTALGTANSAATPLAFNLDFTGTSQYGSVFGVNALSQDGFSSGRLNGFNIGSDGVVQGRYSNGQSRSLGQIVLANFTNPNGLKPLGNNQWAETPDSNQPLIGTPGSGSLGVMQSASVEESNVDLTAELVNMITAQRLYQANAQTIKTQDSIMQTIVNLR